MNDIRIEPIGTVVHQDGVTKIRLEPRYARGLAGLEGFSHIQVLWWAHGCDCPRDRETLTAKKPYCHGPEEMGVFAMRSPERPNPIALSVAGILSADVAKGEILPDFLDAEPGTPVLDIKPYTPSVDRVANPAVPAWCSHWPASYEESGSFDWAAEFNF